MSACQDRGSASAPGMHGTWADAGRENILGNKARLLTSSSETASDGRVRACSKSRTDFLKACYISRLDFNVAEDYKRSCPIFCSVTSQDKFFNGTRTGVAGT
jgi:hypothetical protein